MGPAIGEILPSALGIAISPIPIIAAILMLLSPHARAAGLSFLAGWTIGIVVAVLVFTLLSSILPNADASTSHPIASAIKIVLGVLLLFLAWRQWNNRPQRGENTKLPTWMSAIDTITPVRALTIAFLLSAVNPKNLILAAAAGLAIGGVELVVWQSTVVLVIFALIAASTVLVPVIAYLFAAEAVRAPLNGLRTWLVMNNATIMAVLFLVLGAVVVGKGIGGF
jgi:threonine/homoserine/homoserine lactone efflux protein